MVLRLLGVLLFMIGILLGVALMGAAAWGDIEAIFYGFDTIGGKPLSTLKCPVLMTTGETAKISVRIKNPTKQTIEPVLRADISQPGVFRQEMTQLSLAPGETKQVDWMVTKEDVDLRFFVLVKAYAYAISTLPFREATCGILILDLPGLTGSQILATALALMLLGIITGLLLWQSSSKPLFGRRLDAAWAMCSLAGVVLLGVFSALMGWLLLNFLILVLCILLFSAFLYFAFSTTA